MDQENRPDEDEVDFGFELERLLPADLPSRALVVAHGARHLELIAEANQQFNLTRITGAREAAIKHVVDSVLPWELFSDARRVLDAGTGAGFPGIPLALVFPDKRFILSESIGKKARFVQTVVERLKLTNVQVSEKRSEELLRNTRVEIVTARALAPISRALDLFLPALKHNARVLLYKGPDVHEEISAAGQALTSRRITARIVFTYTLPDSLGSRTIVELTAA